MSSNQSKGYVFEQFLNNLFNSFSLDPRSSYKTEYDQIDGSFELANSTVLLEAKYRGSTPKKDDLILFEGKINRTSNLTRGLFISLTPIEEKTINFYKAQPTRFVAMTVEEIFLLLYYQRSLVDLLKKKFRYLDETGVMFKHFSQLGLL